MTHNSRNPDVSFLASGNSPMGADQSPIGAFYSRISANPHRTASGNLGKAHPFVAPPAISPAQAVAGVSIGVTA